VEVNEDEIRYWWWRGRWVATGRGGRWGKARVEADGK